MDEPEVIHEESAADQSEEQADDGLFDSFYGCNEGRIDFLDLPVDIIYELFELFTNKDLVRVREVCRGWNATYWSIITSYDWRMFAKEKFDGTVLYSLAKRFGGLKRVDLSNCELIPTATIIDALSNVPGLTELNLAGTKVNSTDMIDALDKLPRIHRLNLSYTSINDRVVAKICELYFSNLRELRIDSCQVLLDTSSLAKLKRLQILSLKQCRKITPAALENIKTLTNLQELRLVNNNNITSQMLSNTLAALPDLEILELGFYDLTPVLLDAILNRRPLKSFIYHQLKPVDVKAILRILGKIKNYTHKGMTMDKKALTSLLEEIPVNVQYAHFEGMDGPRELSFSIGPCTPEVLPVHLTVKENSEFREFFQRIKKPKWKFTCTTIDHYGHLRQY